MGHSKCRFIQKIRPFLTTKTEIITYLLKIDIHEKDIGYKVRTRKEVDPQSKQDMKRSTALQSGGVIGVKDASRISSMEFQTAPMSQHPRPSPPWPTTRTFIHVQDHPRSVLVVNSACSPLSNGTGTGSSGCCDAGHDRTNRQQILSLSNVLFLGVSSSATRIGGKERERQREGAKERAWTRRIELLSHVQPSSPSNIMRTNSKTRPDAGPTVAFKDSNSSPRFHIDAYEGDPSPDLTVRILEDGRSPTISKLILLDNHQLKNDAGEPAYNL